MPPLPVVSGRTAIRVFEKIGYRRVSQRGSHVKLKKPHSVPLSIPLHKELDTGLLRSFIRDAGLTVEEFVEVLRDL